MNSQATNVSGFFARLNPTELQPEAYHPLWESPQQFMTDQDHAFHFPHIPQDSLIQAPQDAGPVVDFDGSLVSFMGPPPKRRKKKAPTLRAKDWEPYKARILDLHVTQKLSLETVKNMIETEFGFTADQWGKDKNIKPAEMAAIVRKRQKRKLVENDKRDQRFTVRERVVEPQKIDRWMNRHEISQATLYVPSPAASTPSAVGCQTISEIGSVGPSPVFSAKSPDIPPGATISMAPSPVAPSPTPSLWTVAQSRTGVFSGQSPAPIHQPLPTNMLLSHDPAPNAFFPNQVDPVLTTRRYRYMEADEERLREELFVTETTHGASDHQTLGMLYDLAGVLMDQGRYKSAEEVIRRALNGYRNPCRHQSVQWLEAMDCLGNVLYLQGLYPQALQLQQRILQWKKAILREDHLSTLISMIQLSGTYTEQKQLEEAEMLAAHAVKILSRTQSEEHPETIGAMSDLMWIYNYQGRFDEAEELGLSVVARGTKVFGEQHFRTLKSPGGAEVE
ncbi:Kinesin light chain 2 [Fusarium acuminatum]|uniref:Kinesin light chain 2 n=1 Tax=Fusarium acuminatum TaxID=5515 RepID=A0ABZ2WVP3_9HYPO